MMVSVDGSIPIYVETDDPETAIDRVYHAARERGHEITRDMCHIVEETEIG